MKQRMMEAEILFLNPNDVGPGSIALIEHGFEVETLDWVDDYGPTVWIRAKITSELDEGELRLGVKYRRTALRRCRRSRSL